MYPGASLQKTRFMFAKDKEIHHVCYCGTHCFVLF